MEDRVWLMVSWMIELVPATSKRCLYDTQTILKVGLFAVLRDRPFCWACEPQNWPEHLRPPQLPNQSTLSRRWRSKEITAALKDLHALCRRLLGSRGRYAKLDARPLVIGGAGKDPDARAGRAVGGMGRGYKLYAMVDAAGVVASFRIRPMNEAEPLVAQELMQEAPGHLTRIVGDTIYDSVALHRTAKKFRRRLYSPLRENRVGKRQQPERLRVLRVIRTKVGRKLLHWRDQIERDFGRMSNLGFGLKGLPPWVRRIHRVTAWVSGKILLYHAYLICHARAKNRLDHA